MNVERQPNNHMYEVFAIAFAKSILIGQDPTHLYHVSPRSNLEEILQKSTILLFSEITAALTQRMLHQVEMLNWKSHD